MRVENLQKGCTVLAPVALPPPPPPAPAPPISPVAIGVGLVGRANTFGAAEIGEDIGVQVGVEVRTAVVVAVAVAVAGGLAVEGAVIEAGTPAVDFDGFAI